MKCPLRAFLAVEEARKAASSFAGKASADAGGEESARYAAIAAPPAIAVPARATVTCSARLRAPSISKCVWCNGHVSS